MLVSVCALTLSEELYCFFTKVLGCSSACLQHPTSAAVETHTHTLLMTSAYSNGGYAHRKHTHCRVLSEKTTVGAAVCVGLKLYNSDCVCVWSSSTDVNIKCVLCCCSR